MNNTYFQYPDIAISQFSAEGLRCWKCINDVSKFWKYSFKTNPKDFSPDFFYVYNHQPALILLNYQATDNTPFLKAAEYVGCKGAITDFMNIYPDVTLLSISAQDTDLKELTAKLQLTDLRHFHLMIHTNHNLELLTHTSNLEILEISEFVSKESCAKYHALTLVMDHNPKLRDLSVDAKYLTQKDLKCLLSHKGMQRLTRLTLKNCHRCDSKIMELWTTFIAEHQCLVYLKMVYCKINNIEPVLAKSQILNLEIQLDCSMRNIKKVTPDNRIETLILRSVTEYTFCERSLVKILQALPNLKRLIMKPGLAVSTPCITSAKLANIIIAKNLSVFDVTALEWKSDFLTTICNSIARLPWIYIGCRVSDNDLARMEAIRDLDLWGFDFIGGEAYSLLRRNVSKRILEKHHTWWQRYGLRMKAAIIYAKNFTSTAEMIPQDLVDMIQCLRCDVDFALLIACNHWLRIN